jgi:hypothetical protein
MVLEPQGSGRVGRRQAQHKKSTFGFLSRRALFAVVERIKKPVEQKINRNDIPQLQII